MHNNIKYWHLNKEFRNPEGSFNKKGFYFTAVRWLWNRIFTPPYKLGIDLPINHVLSREEALKLINAHTELPSITWLGHASFIFKIGNIEILTDPLLSGNPAPSFIKGLERLPNPFLPKDLSEVTVLLISHEHLDHIHRPSLKRLLHQDQIQPVVPLGVGGKIRKYNFKKPIELDWFESCYIGNDINITAMPAAHYSDFFNSTLWSGYIINFKDKFGIGKKIYFGGDSGYGPFFKRDIAQYGPFDVACIGVGGFYLPFPTNAPLVHTNPEQAIQIAKDIRAKKIIGMHWGTIRMTDENPNELFPRMEEYAKKIDYRGEIKMLRIGETISIL